MPVKDPAAYAASKKGKASRKKARAKYRAKLKAEIAENAVPVWKPDRLVQAMNLWR